MDALAGFLNTLNTLSPLAVIALLALVLLHQAKNVKMATTQNKTLDNITENHLHELPTIAETLRDISTTLQRIEVSQSENFSHIKAKLNGGSK
jgi:hypothetical protein